MTDQQPVMHQMPPRAVRSERGPWLLSGLWLLLLGTSWAIGWWHLGQSSRDLAVRNAEVHLQKDLLYRRWAASHGGVYVPPTSEYPPNPYLSHIAERDIVTPSGRKLTLVNPAYMSRQVNEMGRDEYGAQGRLTSKNPIRPENGPDDWELQALNRLENGEDEVWEISDNGDGEAVRLMLPFLVERPCLKCHENQGYKVGQLRGAIGVTVPLALYSQKLAEERLGLSILHIMFLAAGLALIWVFHRRTLRHRRAAEASEARSRCLLIQSEARQRSYLEHAPYGVFIADNTGRYLQVNPAACQITGYSEEELLERSIPDLLTPESLSAGLAHFRRLLADGRASGEVAFRTKAGETRLWLVDAVKVDEDTALGFVQDVTDKRRLEQEKAEADSRARHQQKLESIGTLASGVAHEINNPLNVIMNYAQLIIDELPSGDARKDYAKQIVDESERVAHIVRSLLAFSRNEQQVMKPINLGEVLASVLTLVKGVLNKDQIALELTMPAELPSVNGRGQHLAQVFMNLISNARDALNESYPAGSERKRLTISMKVVESEGARLLRASFEDSGTGIPNEAASRIFEPFFSTKPRHKGSGIGLYVSHSIVKEHSGRLWFESKPGSGTAFHVDLPLQPTTD